MMKILKIKKYKKNHFNYKYKRLENPPTYICELTQSELNKLMMILTKGD